MKVFDNRMVSEAARGVKSLLGVVDRTVRSRATRSARRQITAKNAEVAALKREISLAREAGYAPEAGPAGAPVFFVLGQQKSGTTWLMRMLDAHPEILCKGEGRFFGGGWRQKSLKRADVQRPPGSLYNALLDAEYLRLWVERSVWSRDEPVEEHLFNLTRMSIDYFLESELLKTGKKIVGDKSPLLTPDTMKEAGEIYPEARVIHIIRDGRDAAVSAAHHTWNFGNPDKNTEVAAKRDAYRGDPEEFVRAGESIFTEDQIEKLATDWNDRVGGAMKDGPALLGDNYLETRYESLVERPEKELRRIMEFLGARADEETVRRCVEAASFKRSSKGRERGQEDPSSFFRKGVVGDWRNVFSDRDKLIFKERAGSLLIRLGYEEDNRW